MPARGRVRARLALRRMTLEQADLLEAWLLRQPGIARAVVHERTRCVILWYEQGQEAALDALRSFDWRAPRARRRCRRTAAARSAGNLQKN